MGPAPPPAPPSPTRGSPSVAAGALPTAKRRSQAGNAGSPAVTLASAIVSSPVVSTA